jgi:RimJ/RimL family protein N-acetyltransferase
MEPSSTTASRRATDELPPFAPRPAILEGRWARLEPLSTHHAAGLLPIGADEETWRFTTRSPFRSQDEALQYIHAAQANAVAFAILDRATGRVAGSTRYFDIRPRDRGLEIGHTWLGVAFQRTAINTECKYLLLRHAFEDLGALRVQLKTDARNVRSQAAIERLGAVREGVLRHHMVLPDGHLRDTVMYSILRPEWLSIRERLERFMESR